MTDHGGYLCKDYARVWGISSQGVREQDLIHAFALVSNLYLKIIIYFPYY